MCVLGDPEDGDDKAADTTTNLTKTCWATATDEDVAAPETTMNPNQLKMSGERREELMVDDTILRGYDYSQKTEPVRGRLGDDMKKDRATNLLLAAEVTGHVMHDVHTGTPVLKALRTTITLAKRRDGRHRLPDSALHGTTVMVAHANLDEAMGFSLQGGVLPESHHGTRMASKRRRQNHRRIPGTRGWTASRATPGVLRRRDHAGQTGVAETSS